MSYNPLKLHATKKKKPLCFDEDFFFTMIGTEAGGIDKELSKRLYFGFVKHISKQLTREKMIRLPHLGDFAIRRRKESLLFSGNRQTRTLIEANCIKFYPADRWKAHFNLNGALDV